MRDYNLPEVSPVDELIFENNSLRAEIVTLKKMLEAANAKNKGDKNEHKG